MSNKGFTLLEVLVSIGVLSMLVVGTTLTFTKLSRVVANAEVRSIETQLLSASLESLYVLPYEHVGLVGETPEGILSISTVVRNGYSIEMSWSTVFVDDVFDGVGPDDVRPQDYKKVEARAVCVSCDSLVTTSRTVLVAPEHFE